VNIFTIPYYKYQELIMSLSTPINLTQRGLTANAGVLTTLYPHSQEVNEGGGLKVVSAVFNGADATIVKGAAIATSDAFPLVSIPAGAFVLAVTHKVTTAEGATCTYSIGDTTTPAGYVAASAGLGNDTATNGSSFNATTTPTYGVGKYYAAANTVDLTLVSGTATKVVVKVSVAYIQTAPLTN
jgi:hypothetical protein